MIESPAQFYHYTKSIETLGRYIIPGGFWPQYSLEDFSWVQGGKPLYLAFPCVCFTDLPLERSAMHRDDYGDYVIGFSSDWKSASQLRQLQYVTAEDKSRPLLDKKHCRALTKCGDLDVSMGVPRFSPTKLVAGDFEGVWDILPYLKENLGYTLQRPNQRGDHKDIGLTKDFKDEREWRYIPETHRNSLFTVGDYDFRTMDELGVISEAAHDSHLKFDLDEISIIILRSDEERRQFSTEFPSLAERIRIWDELPPPIEAGD